MKQLSVEDRDKIRNLALMVRSRHIHTGDELRDMAQRVLNMLDGDTHQDAEQTWNTPLAREFYTKCARFDVVMFWRVAQDVLTTADIERDYRYSLINALILKYDSDGNERYTYDRIVTMMNIQQLTLYNKVVKTRREVAVGLIADALDIMKEYRSEFILQQESA